MSSFLAGALMMTLAAPASRWARAFSPSVKTPVDSTTIWIPRSAQGSAAGSRSLKARMARPSTAISPSPAVTSPG